MHPDTLVRLHNAISALVDSGAKPPDPYNEGVLGDVPVALGTRFG